MNLARTDNLVSKLRYNVKPRRPLRNVDGPRGRIAKIQKTLTALIQYERIELYYPRADETRGYVERLISEAIRHGPTQETMELADFWILEKQFVHKLFKVLVPRYQQYTTSYTKMYKAPNLLSGLNFDRAVLELKGNIYPSIDQNMPDKYNLLHNILLSAAKKEYRMEKYEQMAESLKQQT